MMKRVTFDYARCLRTNEKIKTSIEEYLELIANPSHAHTYCEWCKGTDVIKIAVDLDSKEKGPFNQLFADSLLKCSLDYLHFHLPGCRTEYASYHRPVYIKADDTDTNTVRIRCGRIGAESQYVRCVLGTKYSFHIIVQGFKIVVTDLIEFTKQMATVCPGVDTRFFKDGCKIRTSNQHKQSTYYQDILASEAPVLSSENLLDYILHNVSDTDILYKVTSAPTAAKAFKKAAIDRVINTIPQNKKAAPQGTKPAKILTAGQKKYIRTILNEIDIVYADDYVNWVKIACILCNYSKTEDGFQLFNEFSKRSKKYVSESDARYTWDSIGVRLVGPVLTIATLIFLHKGTEKHTKLNYSLLYDIVEYNPKLDLETYVNEYYKINKRFIVSKPIISNTDYIDVLNALPDFMKLSNLIGKILCVSAGTGAGKTQLLKAYGFSLKSCGIGIICSGPRNSLNKKTAKDLGLDFFRKGMSGNLNYVYQAETLLHIFASFLKMHSYGILFDEFHSFFMHIMNDSTLMSSIRIEIINILKELIAKARYVICVDADLCAPTIQMLKELTTKKIVFVDNVFQRTFNYQITIDSEEAVAVNKALSCILNDEKFVFCADSKQDVIRIRNSLVRRMTDAQKKNVLTYTADEGNKDDLTDANEKFKDKFVFMSPTVIYGIDYNITGTHHVIGCYSGLFDAQQVRQQINRVRYPLSMTVVFTKRHKTVPFSSIEEAGQAYAFDSSALGNVKGFRAKHLENESLKKMTIIYDFYKSQMRNTYDQFKFHLLREGHKNIIDKIAIADLEGVERPAVKAKVKVDSKKDVKEEQKKNLRNGNKVETKVVDNRKKDLGIEKKLTQTQSEVLLDDKQYGELEKYKYIKEEEWKHGFAQVPDNNVNILRTNRGMIKAMMDLQNMLGIKNSFVLSNVYLKNKEENAKRKMDIHMFNACVGALGTTQKKYKNINNESLTYELCYGLLVDFYKKMFKTLLVEKRFNGRRSYVIDQSKVRVYKGILGI